VITWLPEIMGRPGGARRSRFDLAPGATGIMLVMTIQAVVFDIGGVLEITPDLGVTGMWESRLGLGPGELDKRMYDVWRGGSIGTVSEREVHQAVSEILGLDGRQRAEFMADIWREYLGTANTELIEYARRLRSRYRTGILSNSFAGAREREQAAYGFEDLVDEIIYSHECGMRKPGPGIYAWLASGSGSSRRRWCSSTTPGRVSKEHARRVSTRCCTKTTARQSATSRTCSPRPAAGSAIRWCRQARSGESSPSGHEGLPVPWWCCGV
jgi:FMN phosphatase YigB (HAD superfamily)